MCRFNLSLPAFSCCCFARVSLGFPKRLREKGTYLDPHRSARLRWFLGATVRIEHHASAAPRAAGERVTASSHCFSIPFVLLLLVLLFGIESIIVPRRVDVCAK